MINPAILMILIYLIWILLLSIGWLKLKKNPSLLIFKQSITIIVAAKNEAINLPILLQSILTLNYPKHLLKFIFINDHSSDETLDLFKIFKNQHLNLNIQIINAEEEHLIGKKNNIRNAVAQVTTDYIYTTDADCRLPENVLGHLINNAVNNQQTLVYGPVIYDNTSNRLSQIFQLEFASLVAASAGGVGIGCPFMCNAANMLIHTKTYQDLSFSDSHQISGDDVFLLHQIKKQYSAQFIGFCKNKECIVQTKSPENLRAFFKQRERWASKTTAYKDSFAIFSALLVFIYCVTIIITLIGACFHVIHPFLLLGLYLCKIIGDFPLLWMFCRFTKQKTILRFYLPLQIIYPFYIVYTAFKSLRQPQWK